jgi:glutamate dehydrogenase (NAD(P)+)
MTATWTDAGTGARGHVVIDTRIRGVAGGGLRMRPGLTVDEVADLARAMTRKEALAFRPDARYVPLGGAKGGIDFDPRDPRALGVLERFVEAVRPLLEHVWAAGEDMGVRQDDLDRIAAGLGLRSTVDCVLGLIDDGADAGLERLDAAFAAQDRGIGLGELVGGYGVARAALEALGRIGIAPAGARVVVQGFGSMGGATARYLADAGLRVVGLADVDGVVAAAHGLDVETLLHTRDRHGRIDRAALRPGDVERPGEDWARIPCEVLVPAAASYVIGEELAAALDAGDPSAAADQLDAIERQDVTFVRELGGGAPELSADVVDRLYAARDALTDALEGAGPTHDGVRRVLRLSIADDLRAAEALGASA